LIVDIKFLEDWSTVLASIWITIRLFVESECIVSIFASSSITFLSAIVLSLRLFMADAFSRCSQLGHSMRIQAPDFFLDLSNGLSM
jgi:hypothetical protein